MTKANEPKIRIAAGAKLDRANTGKLRACVCSAKDAAVITKYQRAVGSIIATQKEYQVVHDTYIAERRKMVTLIQQRYGVTDASDYFYAYINTITADERAPYEAALVARDQASKVAAKNTQAHALRPAVRAIMARMAGLSRIEMEFLTKGCL